MDVFLFIIAALVALILIGSILAKLPGACHRDERLKAIAQKHDLVFEPDSAAVPDEPYSHFATFRVAGDLSLLSTMRGSMQFRVGDHECACRVHLGDFEQVYEEYDPTPFNLTNTAHRLHRRSYLLVQLPIADLPAMRIRHRRGPGGVGVLPGRQAIQFEWDQFNRDMQVTGSDRRFAFDVISKRMMEFLHANPTYPLAIESGWMCITDGNTQWSPGEFEEAIEWTRKFLGLWPRYLAPSVREP